VTVLHEQARAVVAPVEPEAGLLQGGVDIDHQAGPGPPARRHDRQGPAEYGRASQARSRPSPGPRATRRGARRRSRPDPPGGRGRGHRTEQLGLFPQHARSLIASPPSASVTARSVNTRPGPCADRRVRPTAATASNPASRPVTWAMSACSRDPACDTTPAPSAVTVIPRSDRYCNTRVRTCGRPPAAAGRRLGPTGCPWRSRAPGRGRASGHPRRSP
jgi:hypothetical protein